MAITDLTFTISEIPALMHRADVINFPADEDLFNSKYEANNDHLSGTTVAELNAMKTELNIFSNEVQVEKLAITAQAQIVTTNTALATQSATDASTSAAYSKQMRDETEELIELLPTDASLAYSKEAIDTKIKIRNLENFLNFKF